MINRSIRPLSALAPVLLAGAVPAALPAVAQDAPVAAAPKEARIPFASLVRDYRAEDRDVIYLRAGRDWYRGTFLAPCQELPWAWNIRFENSPGIDAIDRFSTVIARGERCRLSSLVKIDGQPPAKAKKPQNKD